MNELFFWLLRKSFIKVRGPFVEKFCIKKDSYIDAIYCENSFKLCLFIPK